MMPVLWEVPGLGWDIPGYGVALMIGFLVSIWWAAQRALKSGANPDVVLNCGFIALIGGVLGSRIMFVWHYWEQFAHREGNLLLSLLDVRRGGLEVYGGVVAVVIGVYIYLKWYKHSIRWYLDILAPSAALGMGIGRIGCFLNGCCWGGVCDLPWSVQFPYGSPPAMRQWTDRLPGAGLPDELVYEAPLGLLPDGSAAQPVTRDLLSVAVSDADIARAQAAALEFEQQMAKLAEQLATTDDPQQKAALRSRVQALEQQRAQVLAEYIDIRAQMAKYGLSAEELRTLARQHPSLPVHPTQLYSVITLVLLALLLDALYWRRTRDGQVICLFLFIEPLTRWMIEVLRADNPVDALGVFTISQFMAVSLSAVGLIGLLALRWLPPRSPRAQLWEEPGEEDAEKPAESAAAGP